MMLHEGFAEQAFGVECARSGRGYQWIEAGLNVGIVTLLQNVDKATEQIGGEMEVDKRWLIVEHRYAVPHTLGDLLTRQGKGLGYGGSRRLEVRADQLSLQVECVANVRARL